MAKFSRIDVFNVMKNDGLVPLFYNSDINICKKIIDSCYSGGSRIIEYTSRGDNAHVIFEKLIDHVNNNCPGLILGVGSLTNSAETSYFIQIGANFIVTPVLRKDIAYLCNRKKIFWSAGCGSLNEICKAEELGCEIVKLFPGQVYGAEFIKAIKGPQPWTNIMPTGGVLNDKINITSWINSGAICIGMGSKLITKDIVESENYEKLTKDVKNILSIIKSSKKNK